MISPNRPTLGALRFPPMMDRARHTLTGVALGCAASVVGLLVGLVL